MATALWYKANRKVLRLVNAASLSVAASATSSSTYEIRDMDRVSSFWVNVTAIAGGSATVTIKLQHSPDGGVTWLDSGMATSALSATDSGIKVDITVDLYPTIKLVATLSNTTTPTATYSAWVGYDSPQGGLPRSGP